MLKNSTIKPTGLHMINVCNRVPTGYLIITENNQVLLKDLTKENAEHILTLYRKLELYKKTVIQLTFRKP